MENDMRGRHGRPMSGEEAFEAMYGSKAAEYPAEMKQEFIAVFDRAQEAMKSLHAKRKAFMDKWKDTIGDDRHMPDEMRQGLSALFGMFGRPDAPGPWGHGFREACGARRGGGPGFFER